MTTVATKRPLLTPEERKARWLGKQTYPCYVRDTGKHGDNIYLIQSSEDLIATALQIVKDRKEIGYFGEPGDFFTGTYEEFVQQEMGMSIAEVEALVIDKEPKIRELLNLKERFLSLRRSYAQEQESAAELKSVDRILNGDIDPYYAITILINRAGYQYEGFEISQFTKID